MRERLAALTANVSAKAAPTIARVRQASIRGWAGAAVWSGRLWRWTAHAVRVSFEASKRALKAVLGVIEETLLSPKGRERVHAASVFALIFGFAITSVDMLVTGGPELISSARAASAPSPRVDLIAATSRGAEDGDIALAALESEVDAIELAPASATGPAPIAQATVVQVADLADATPVKAEHVETPAAQTAAEAKVKDEA